MRNNALSYMVKAGFIGMCVFCSSHSYASEKPAISYDEYIATALDEPVIIEAYVQAKQEWYEGNSNVGTDTASIYAQDEEGGYFLYDMPVSKDVYDQLEIGTKIRASGYKSEWAGEIEVVTDDALTPIEILDGNYIAKPTDVTELLTDETALKVYQNQKVCFTDMTVESCDDNGTSFLYGWDGSGSEGDDLYFVASKNNHAYTFTIESYLCGPETDVYKAVKELNVGEKISMEGFLYWYEGPQPHITSIGERGSSLNMDSAANSSIAETDKEELAFPVEETEGVEQELTESMSEEYDAAFTGEIPENTMIPGKAFEFDEKAPYPVLSSDNQAAAVPGMNTYGYFSISGNIASEEERDGIPAYGIDGGQVYIYYTYTNKITGKEKTEWHLVNDSGKKVDTVKLQHEIKKGAIILQTSLDRKTWVSVVKLTNAFDGIPVQWKPFYMTKGIQLVNGCYYRAIIAYKEGMNTGQDQVLFIKTDKNSYRKYAELYEFYLYDINNEKEENILSRSLGELTRTSGKGYSGTKSIEYGDPHYGWNMGHFFVSGYTRETSDGTGNPVFLKNVGDKVTLWFRLEQDIMEPDEQSNLEVSNDKGAYDQYFQTKKTNMGKGTLIIRYTDVQGIKHEPEIYTNYLEASASTSADTIVKLFEEGDYEVALDYELKKTPRKLGSIEVIPEFFNYRIFLKFSVRNGNCMVFPFDVTTGEELTNRAITENGFYLDLAKSKYLDITIKRSVIAEGVDGLTEDVRFNRPAKDGDEYTDPGLYAISVKNLYTNETTIKEIFVGSDSLLEEYLKQGVSMDDLIEE